MKNNLSCAIVQDLLPNYAESLTSEETNIEIKNHLDNCTVCQSIYETMVEQSVESAQLEQKEIDFLKKTRNRTRRIVISAFIGAFLTILLLFIADVFFIGNKLEHVNVTRILFKDDNTIEVNGNCDGNMGFKKLDVVEEGGCLSLNFKGTRKSGIYHNDFSTTYTANNPITEICVGNQIVWKDGISISRSTSALYETRHDYAGDMSANEKTAVALNMKNIMLGYTNELHTSKEPYGWSLITQVDLKEQNKDVLQQNLKNRAYAILASIGNLSYVTYQYVYNGEIVTLKVTADEATDYAGENIKSVGADILKLEKLMKKSGLISTDDVLIDREVNFSIVNDAEPLQEIRTKYLIGDQVHGGSGVINADSTLIKTGEKLDYSVYLNTDFGGIGSMTDDASVQIYVVDSNGQEHKVEFETKVSDLLKMTKKELHLTGKDGKYQVTN